MRNALLFFTKSKLFRSWLLSMAVNHYQFLVRRLEVITIKNYYRTNRGVGMICHWATQYIWSIAHRCGSVNMRSLFVFSALLALVSTVCLSVIERFHQEDQEPSFGIPCCVEICQWNVTIGCIIKMKCLHKKS